MRKKFKTYRRSMQIPQYHSRDDVQVVIEGQETSEEAITGGVKVTVIPPERTPRHTTSTRCYLPRGR